MKKSTINLAMAPLALGTGAIIGRFASRLMYEDDPAAAKLLIRLGSCGLCAIAVNSLSKTIDEMLNELEAAGVKFE